jgi:hypothetical protein
MWLPLRMPVRLTESSLLPSVRGRLGPRPVATKVVGLCSSKQSQTAWCQGIRCPGFYPWGSPAKR